MILDITNLTEEQAIKRVREAYHPKTEFSKLVDKYAEQTPDPTKTRPLLEEFSEDLIQLVHKNLYKKRIPTKTIEESILELFRRC